MGQSHYTNGNTVSELVITNLKLGADITNSLTATTLELNSLASVATTNFKVVKYTVLSADQTATTVSIPVGFTVGGFVCNILRAGKDVTNLAAISASTTNLVVATNAANYVLTTGDVIQALTWK